MMKHLAIIGYSLRHTLSPVMHTAVVKHLGLPYSFGVLDVHPELLPSVVLLLKRDTFQGANVTIPHKGPILDLLDEVEEDAASIAAVNTVVNVEGRLIGYNTDIVGITKSLNPWKDSLRGASVVILGAGGAARAALFALLKFFSPKAVTVHNRSADRSARTVAMLRQIFPGSSLSHINTEPALESAIKEATLVINATSVGMYPAPDMMPVSDKITFSNYQIIFDIVYNPHETKLLRHAASYGARVINGVEMFLHQGARAFELWTGRQFPIDIARKVVLDALTNH